MHHWCADAHVCRRSMYTVRPDTRLPRDDEEYRLVAVYEESRAKELPPGESWATRLKQHREKLGISQMIAAEQIGTSRVYLAQVERGRKPSPTLEGKLRRWIEGGQVTPEQ